MDEVLFEIRDDGVALITLNRPDSLNALTPGMFAELGRPILGGQSPPGAVGFRPRSSTG